MENLLKEEQIKTQELKNEIKNLQDKSHNVEKQDKNDMQERGCVFRSVGGYLTGIGSKFIKCAIKRNAL